MKNKRQRKKKIEFNEETMANLKKKQVKVTSIFDCEEFIFEYVPRKINEEKNY